MKARIFSLLLIVALLVSVSVFAAEATGYTPDFTNADGTNAVETACPHCKETSVTWKPFPGQLGESVLEDVHYYVTGTYSNGRQYCQTIEGAKACFYFLNNAVYECQSKTTAGNGSAFALSKGAELAIMGTGTIKGSGYGNSITSTTNYTGGVIKLWDASDETKSNKLTIYDGITVERTYNSNQTKSGNGGVIYVGKYNQLDIKGGTIKGLTEQAVAGNGGAVYLNEYAEATMSGGAIQGGRASATSAGFGGSAVFVNANATFTMDGTGTIQGAGGCNAGGSVLVRGTFNLTAGTIEASTAAVTNGGAVAVYGGGQLNISSSTYTGKEYPAQIIFDSVTEGENATPSVASQHGGLILMSGGTSQINMYNGALVSGGRTQTGFNGGNIKIDSGTMTMNGGCVENGNAATHGGNISIQGGALNFYGGTIQNGTAGSDGGNIYVGFTAQVTMSENLKTADNKVIETKLIGGSAKAGGSVAMRKDDGSDTKFTMEGGTIDGGEATTYGGNVRVAKGQFELKAGTIEKGKASSGGANIYVLSGTLDFNGGQTRGGMLSSSSVNMANSDAVEINLDKDAQVDQLVIPGPNPAVAVNIKRTFEGSVNLRCGWNDLFLTLECGSVVTGNMPVTVEPAYTNKASICVGIDLDGSDEADSKTDRPYIPAVYTNDQLMIAYYSSVDTTGKTMFDSSKATRDVAKEIGIASVADVAEGAYVKVYGTGAEQTLNGNVTIDMNGEDLAVTGSGTVTMKDSISKDFTSAAGTLTVAEGSTVTVANASEIIDGMIAVKTDSTYKAYPLELKVNSVALRTWANGEDWSGNGIYYGAKLKTHKDLEVTAGGIAVKKDAAVNKSFVGTGYTENAAWKGTGLNTESQAYGVMVSNILDAGTQYIDDEIYAAAYIIVGENQDFWSTGEEPHYSIQSIVNAYNDLHTNSAAMANLKKFYDYWSVNGIDFAAGGWTVDNIKNYGATA